MPCQALRKEQMGRVWGWVPDELSVFLGAEVILAY